MHYQSILIITYGRSGSTLLQGLLNSIEGCLIRGENHLFPFGLFHTFCRIREAKKTPGLDVTHPWYGSHLLSEEIFLKYTRAMVKELLFADVANPESITCYGFKEIRYQQVRDYFTQYLDFMRMIFPNVAFIFNKRNLDDVVKSDWWQERPSEEVRAELLQQENLFDHYHRTHSNTYYISYEEVLAKGKALEGLFAFLGAPYNEQVVNRVLNTPHSLRPNQESVRAMSKITD